MKRTVIWDSHCSFCRPWAVRLARLDLLGSHTFIGTAEPGAYDDPRVTREDTDRALQLLTPKGRYEGYDAIRRVLLHSPLTFWLAWLAWLPGAHALGSKVYSHIADNRACSLAAAQAPLLRRRVGPFMLVGRSVN